MLRGPRVGEIMASIQDLEQCCYIARVGPAAILVRPRHTANALHDAAAAVVAEWRAWLVRAAAADITPSLERRCGCAETSTTRDDARRRTRE